MSQRGSITKIIIILLLLGILSFLGTYFLGSYLFNKDDNKKLDSGGVLKQEPSRFLQAHEEPEPLNVYDETGSEIVFPNPDDPNLTERIVDSDMFLTRGPDTFWYDQSSEDMVLMTVDGTVESVDLENNSIKLSRSDSEGNKQIRIIDLSIKEVPLFIVEYVRPAGAEGFAPPSIELTKATLSDIQEGYRVTYNIKGSHTSQERILIEKR